MTDTRYFVNVILGIVIFLIGLVWLLATLSAPSNNPCITIEPHEVVSGCIYHYGLFSKGIVYYLDYKGKRKLTDDECLKRYVVTEAEYDRRMYRKENSDE